MAKKYKSAPTGRIFSTKKEAQEDAYAYHVAKRLSEQTKRIPIKYIDVDMSMLGTQGNEAEQAKNRLAAISEDNKSRIEQQKIDLQRQQMQSEIYNRAADRAVKMEDIKSKERIAKTNKNKYDNK